MGETFMSAITKIEELITKKKQINDRAASLLSEAILDRIRSGNLTRNSEKDIKNSLREFSLEEREEILTKALIYVGMNTTSNKSTSQYNDDDDDDFTGRSGKKVKNRADLFGRRYDD